MTDSQHISVYREFCENRLVEILDGKGTRSLYFGGQYLQSRMALHAPHLLLLPYTHYMMFSLLLARKIERVLLIGLGAGSLVRFLHHHFPTCVIDAVDNSERIIKLAKGYFQLPTSHAIRVHCLDGNRFFEVAEPEIEYDMILLDAFDETGMATHIYAEPFIRSCATFLASGGLLISNLWSGGTRPAQDFDAELAPILPGGLLLPVPERGNVISIRSHHQPDWRRICRGKEQLLQLEKHYHIDFPQMVKVAMRHNLSIGQRLARLFSL
ncbi:spermine/spermidine synthase domain-containing protein [Desulfopila aestuarii]|uniref:Spermidine synthase n=1 Tax=Desulfopila aestuarii DSM 18488 TaxID=1121416 RepID=A0A1M7Y5S5_9BACT|nr:hypothetical protein [Desulfopila aestuarii]SHO47892.1 spermidine synthase [Desulfopila aestuarii DSM 18488]